MNIAKMVSENSIDGFEYISKNILDNEYYEKCSCPEYMNSYLDNLERLKLIHISTDLAIVDEGAYDSIEKSERVKSSLLNIDENKIMYEHHFLELTDFGKAFKSCCVS